MRMACAHQVVEESEEWHEWLLRLLRQNLAFIIILVGSLLVGSFCTYCACRRCSFCPVYQRRFHQKTLRTMEIGSRA